MIYLLLFLLSTILVATYTFYEMSYILISKKGIRKKGKIYSFLRRPERVIITILVGTNLFAISASLFFRKFMGGASSGGIVEGGIFVTIILFIFSEMLPKNIATYLHDRFFHIISPFIWITYILFYPLIAFINKITEHFYNKDSKKSEKADRIREAISYISELKKDFPNSSIEPFMDVIEETIRFMSSGVLDYSIGVKEINFIDMDNPDFTKAKDADFSIVYRGSIDNIIGILKTKYIYPIEKGLITMEDSLYKPLFVHEGQKIINVLSILRDNARTEAIVVDEHGSIKGVFCTYILKDLVSRITQRQFIILWGDDRIEKLVRLCNGIDNYSMSVTLHEFLQDKCSKELKPGVSIVAGKCKLTILSMKDGIVGKILVALNGGENGLKL